MERNWHCSSISTFEEKGGGMKKKQTIKRFFLYKINGGRGSSIKKAVHVADSGTAH